MPALAKKQIPVLYQKALALQNAGRINDALAQYQSIAKINPRIPEVHFQVARIFVSGGKYEKALSHAKIAAQIKPKEPALWALWAEVLVGINDESQKVRFFNALRRAPLQGPAKAKIRKILESDKHDSINAGASESDLGALRILAAKGDPTETASQTRAALKQHPKSAALLQILAQADAARGQTNAALSDYTKALALAPNSGEIRNDLGLLLLNHGRLVEAAEELRRAVQAAPDLAAARSNLGRCLGMMDLNADALDMLDKACQMDPDLAEAQFNRATVLVKLERDEEAVLSYQRAIDLGLESAQAYAFLARAQGALRREDEAFINFEKAIALKPDNAFAFSRRAALQQTRGNFDAAENDFRNAMRIEPNNGQTYRIFSASHKFAPDDPVLMQMLSLWDTTSLSPKNRMHVGFVLSKAMQDCKQYDKVFSYLNPANALMLKIYPYEIQSRATELEHVKKAFTNVNFKARSGVGDDSFAPIFVTGMPRSGTTLVEQILASHSTMTGAGEVGEFSREAYRLVAGPEGALRSVNDLSDGQITDLGQQYSAFMRRLLPDANRVTDKSIQTYLFMGLVKLALPKSRIVVVRRDPRDLLFSIYKNVFHEGSHRYAYNLLDLAAYYKMFEQILDFWRAIDPDMFYEISYDALIADPEKESRALLAACDLEWEDACLEFHNTKRRVDTLSVFQVRQPIYKSSVKSWQHYEKELKPLIDALK